MPGSPSGTSGGAWASCSGSAAGTGWSASGSVARPGLHLGRRPAERADEPLPVLAELRHAGLDARGDFVDRDEERELPLAERVEHLPVAPADLKDRDPVGDELDFGEMVVE